MIDLMWSDPSPGPCGGNFMHWAPFFYVIIRMENWFKLYPHKQYTSS